jgi:uncharacterized caspase-like protein
MNDHHYAVVVGIDRYPGIGDLGGARADADQFAAWLTDPAGGGLPADNVKRVSVTAADEAAFATAHGARPTNVEVDYALQDITGALKVQLAANPDCWEQSRIYLYAAGHGFAPQGGEGALFLANAEPDALARNIELSEYRRWCTSCAFAREVIVFADCCRTRVRSSERGFSPGLAECPAPWNGKASTWLIGFGSNYGNPTYEQAAPGSDDQARGHFTAALLEGLRGGAPRDSSGALTAATLSGYVKALVAERTRNQPYPQDADIIGPLTRDIQFGTTQPPPKRNVTLVFPAGFKGDAKIVKDGRDIATWDGTASEWEVPLDDGLYEVDGADFANAGLFKVAGEDRRVDL